MLENINIPQTWEDAFTQNEFIEILESNILPNYLNNCRWYAGKARTQSKLSIIRQIPVAGQLGISQLLILNVQYTEGEDENYFLPLAFMTSNSATAEIHPKGIITIGYFNKVRGLIIDAIYHADFQQSLYKHLVNNQIISSGASQIHFERGSGLSGEDINKAMPSRVLMVEQSNSSLIYGEKYFVKLYRKLFNETNPEVEMVSFLTEESSFPFIPAYAGSVSLIEHNQPTVTLAVMQRMVDNKADSWTMMGQQLDGFMQGFMGQTFTIEETVFDKIELLAQRTGEMHLALYAPEAEEAFKSVDFDKKYRKFMYDRLKHLLDSRYTMVIESYTKMEPTTQKLAWDFMEAKELIDEFIEGILTKKIASKRTRIHGDYHLGQVLATGFDYIIIDFEGEPESSINDRKIKHSPLKDVAGMLRSFHYAISSKFYSDKQTSTEHNIRTAKASDRWYGLIQKTFLEKYFATFGHPHPLFKDNNEINFLLLIYLLEKAVYELGYEVNYRPEWVKIPLKGIVDVIREIEKLKM